MPRLTVISVVRNDQVGLDKTIVSVSEECPWAEHLVIDGSDSPLSLKSSRAMLRVRYGRDRGISHAFNRGLINSLGEYVVFINAGDTLNSGAGEYLHALLKATSADCLWLSVYRCFHDGAKLVYRPRLNLLKYAMAAPHQGMIVKRDIYAQIGLFPLQKYSMDHYIALRLINARPAYCIEVCDQVMAYYPVGGHSSQGGGWPFLLNCWNVARIAPGNLFFALLANFYLFMKSFITHNMRKG